MGRVTRLRLRRIHLFVAFAFTVMADPVSSVTYAIESTLRALDGDLEDLLPSMAAIVAIIAVISTTYHQLVGRFPAGGGGPSTAGRLHAHGRGQLRRRGIGADRVRA